MSTEERFWAKVNKTATCWLWTAYKTKDGYGRFHFEGKMIGPHRWIYQHAVGQIPEGKEIDHICRTRSCVNPSHLQTLSHVENMKRGNHTGLSNRRKTHCPQGHEYNEANTRFYLGQRKCAICHNRSSSRSKFNTREENDAKN